MKLVLSNATVVSSLEPPRLEQLNVHVAGGQVMGLRSSANGPAGGAVIDCGGCLVVPGNVCAHSHAYSALARGMPYRLPAPQTFTEILQRIWWRLDRALDAESIRASALVTAREALRAGTTTLVDHHASPAAIDGSLDIVAQAFEEVGIRSVLAYEVTDRDGDDRAGEGLQENARFLRRVADGRWPLARGMVGAHASFTLSERTLAACVDLAAQWATGIHIHAAEDGVDQADAIARFGLRAVARLAEAGALTDATLLAHAIHLDPAEAGMVRTAEATVAHNPRSNMNNGVGRMPLGWLGSRVALGTDGIGGDMFEEARAAYLCRREEDPAASAHLALSLLQQGSALAGRMFGEPALGRVEAGAPADLVVLDYPAPTPLDAETLGAHWIFGLSSAWVRDVLVGGEVVVRDRRLTRVDEVSLTLEAAGQARRLWRRMDGIPPHPFAPMRLLATPIGSA